MSPFTRCTHPSCNEIRQRYERTLRRILRDPCQSRSTRHLAFRKLVQLRADELLPLYRQRVVDAFGGVLMGDQAA